MTHIAPAADLAATAAAIAADVAAETGKLSIRQIIIRGLRAGLTTAQIAEQVKAAHPDSAAAAKSAKHIAYYRCLEKQGRNGKA